MASVRLEALVPSQTRSPYRRVLELPGYVLDWPSQLSALSLPKTRTWEIVQQRRLQGRDALKLADTEGINELAERLRARQARVLDIRRTQFEAEEHLRVSGEAQTDREDQANTVLARMTELQDDLALAKAQYEISRALASSENDSFLIPNDPVKVDLEVQRLKAAQLRAEIQIDTTTGVRRARVLWPGGILPKNVRVIYAASRDALKALCERLELEVSRAETSAADKRQQRMVEREKEIGNRVAQRLEGIKSQNESLNLRLDQEDNLGKTLLAEELPTRRASVQASITTGSQFPQVRVRVSGIKSAQSLSKKPAANDLLGELRAAVLDEAQKRGIQVRFSPAPGVPDRTTEFANWIKVKLP